MTEITKSMTEATRAGSCLCGSVTFTARGEPIVVAHCHCGVCQKLSGTGHTIGAMFATSSVAIQGLLAQHDVVSDSGSTVARVFCPACGSPIHGSNTDMPGFITIGLGLFDEPSTFTPQVAIFARHRHHWDVMDEGLATFDTQPDWSPDKSV